jgi:O-methyltransferase involved in polyketide biosynthesis
MGIAITELTPVERTAFVTQYARALDSRCPSPILGDTLADEIAAKIDYDFQALGVPSSAVRQTALRAKMLDERVRGFISEHPDAVVVALGAGLDTGMLRVKPPATVDWYNVDLPNVIALRNELVPGDGRRSTCIRRASGCRLD